MVELRGISKYFPSNGVTALKNAELTLRSGEIHALLGENGTGKSTLMHILAGYFPPTSGTILIDGGERRFSSPADALAQGIGMVRQHPGFIKGFKVWEDCILGAEKPRLRFFLNPGLSRKRLENLSHQWEFDLPLDTQAENLTVSQRQKAAVLALLLRDVKWFIFDEPTAVLTPEETKNLFKLFERLRNEGRGIIVITHKLNEALAISDRLTVIRRGVTEESRNTTEFTEEELRNDIFGFDESAATTAAQPNTASSDKEKLVLEIKNFQLKAQGLPQINNVNLRLKTGKILGIAGVRDSGLETLERALAGFLGQQKQRKGMRNKITNNCPVKIDGSITLNGHDITGKGVRAFRDAGGAYLGSDRLGINLAPDLPLKESLIIHACRRRKGIFLNLKYLNSWCRKIMSRAGIERPFTDKASSFSGGMLQRILLAREFAEETPLVVLAEAGSGLDQLNRTRLEKELKALVRRGASALLFSTDPEELLSIADEIMLLKNGTLENNET